MNKLLYILLVGLLSTSCSSTYYFSKLQSTGSAVKQVENGDFLVENDDLWIAYSFNGWNAPIRITVFNKSNKPLYINWNESTLAFAKNTYTYKQSGVIVESYNIENHQIFDREGKEIPMRRDEALGDHISVIPPNAMVSHIPARMGRIMLENVPKSAYGEAVLPDKENKEKNVKLAVFPADNTPLKFLSTLYVFAKGETPMKFQTEFYMSDLVKTSSLTPATLNPKLVKRGDLFYMERDTDAPVLQRGSNTSVIGGGNKMDVIVY